MRALVGFQDRPFFKFASRSQALLVKDLDLSYLHHQRLCIVTCLFKLCGPHSKPTVGVIGVPKEMIACFMCVAVI